MDVTVLGDHEDEQEELPPEQSRWKDPQLRRKALISAGVIWAVVISVVVLSLGTGKQSAPPAAALPSASPSPSASSLPVSGIYQRLQPSVVLIKAVGAKPGTEATGTGVIVNADGSILTADHVIAGATGIVVDYADGSSTIAIVTSADAMTDIAQLKPARLPETVVPAVIGGGVNVGDPVVAIGNPLGLTFSTTSGVVSGLDRTVARETGGDQTGLIQFDAAVNPGSSGGPLLNDRAQVVGIVVSLANPTDAHTFIGIGFAVPIGSALGAGQGSGKNPPL